MLKSPRVSRRLDRERRHVNLTGMLSLVTIIAMLLLTACAQCPTPSGCPRIPFGYRP